MKKCGIIALLVIITVGELRSDFCDHTSISFMYPRPVTHNLAMQQAAWHDFIYNKTGATHTSVQFAGLYLESVIAKKTNKYFLFNHKNELSVKGDIAPRHEIRDIRAEWLQLPNNFEGTFTIGPKRRQVGFMVEINQNLGKFKIPYFENSWIDVMLPLNTVEHYINLEQNVISGGGTTAPEDIAQAFNRSNMSYARIADPCTTITIPEIRIRLGKAFIAEEFTQIASYNVFVIPVAPKCDPEYMFNNTDGPNGHFGFGSGICLQFPLNKNTEKYAFCFYINLEQVFYARSAQCRTFDLKNKPWSRYLLLNEKAECAEDQVLFATQQPIPAANVLTRDVRIRPYNMVDFSIGWRFQGCKVEAEIGYDAWGHGDEKAELLRAKGHDYSYVELQRCQFFGDKTYGIRGTNGVRTASLSTIDCLAPDDVDAQGNPVFIPIGMCDIDWRSGTGKATITHKFHTDVTFKKKCCKVSGFINLGVSYEIGHNNCALEQWNTWIKIGASV